MPIIRHGYATTRRNGSTRAYRQARAHTIANATHCAICRRPFEPGDLVETDHRVPVARGGVDSIGNLRATHRYCNRARGVGYGD